MENKISKLDHVGIAVHSLQNIRDIFQKIFDLEPEFEESVSDQQVKVAGYRLGNSTIEFLEPTSADSPIAKFLSKKGEGLHHIALGISDIEKTLEKMKSNGLKLIDEKPRRGAEGKLIAFAHPKSFNGVLVEFSQEQKNSK